MIIGYLDPWGLETVKLSGADEPGLWSPVAPAEAASALHSRSQEF